MTENLRRRPTGGAERLLSSSFKEGFDFPRSTDLLWADQREARFSILPLFFTTADSPCFHSHS